MKIWKLKWGRLPCRKKKESPYIDSRKTKVHHIMADIEDYGSSGRSRGGARSPPIFRPNWGPKGRENLFLRPPPPYLRVWITAPPPLISGSGWPPPLISGSGWPSLHPLSRGLDDRPPPLSRGLDDRPSTPYLKVWIRHWVEAEVEQHKRPKRWRHIRPFSVRSEWNQMDVYRIDEAAEMTRHVKVEWPTWSARGSSKRWWNGY